MVLVDVFVGGAIRDYDDGNIIWTAASLIRSQGTVMLFDEGTFQQRFTVKRRLEALGIQRRDVHRVVLSHLHWDHVLNLEMLREAEFGLTCAEWDCVRRQPGRDTATPRCLGAALESQVSVTMADAVDWAGDVHVCPVAGHTVGRVMLVGDALSNEESWLGGSPDPIFYSREEARCSLAYMVAHSDVIVPGHGEPFFTNTGLPAGRTF
ncbi:MAG: MBL fold metallo-hydrolase [Firmicutes bacterium]|nr:MBL fold metallo-hydrolase [Bacillota bacterium]